MFEMFQILGYMAAGVLSVLCGMALIAPWVDVVCDVGYTVRLPRVLDVTMSVLYVCFQVVSAGGWLLLAVPLLIKSPPIGLVVLSVPWLLLGSVALAIAAVGVLFDRRAGFRVGVLSASLLAAGLGLLTAARLLAG